MCGGEKDDILYNITKCSKQKILIVFLLFVLVEVVVVEVAVVSPK